MPFPSFGGLSHQLGQVAGGEATQGVADFRTETPLLGVQQLPVVKF